MSDHLDKARLALAAAAETTKQLDELGWDDIENDGPAAQRRRLAAHQAELLDIARTQALVAIGDALERLVGRPASSGLAGWQGAPAPRYVP